MSKEATEISLAQTLEILPAGQYGLIVLKPDFTQRISDRLGHKFIDLIKGIIISAQLEVIFTTETNLASDDIKTLYATIFFQDSDYGDDKSFRAKVLAYMQSAPVYAFLVRGDQALAKLQLIKRTYRKLVGLETGTDFIRNIVHVPDEDELDTAISVLFGDQIDE